MAALAAGPVLQPCFITPIADGGIALLSAHPEPFGPHLVRLRAHFTISGVSENRRSDILRAVFKDFDIDVHLINASVLPHLRTISGDVGVISQFLAKQNSTKFEEVMSSIMNDFL